MKDLFIFVRIFTDSRNGYAIIVKLLSSPLIYLLTTAEDSLSYFTEASAVFHSKCRLLFLSSGSNGFSPNTSMTAGPPKTAAASLCCSYAKRSAQASFQQTAHLNTTHCQNDGRSPSACSGWLRNNRFCGACAY